MTSRQPGAANRATLTGAAAEQALQALTPRERQILELVAAGLTSPSIAAELGMKVPTVKTHLRSTYAKLGVNNRVQATNIYHLGDPQGRPPQ